MWRVLCEDKGFGSESFCSFPYYLGSEVGKECVCGEKCIKRTEVGTRFGLCVSRREDVHFSEWVGREVRFLDSGKLVVKINNMQGRQRECVW